MIDSKKLFENKIGLYIEPAYFIVKQKTSKLTFSINKLNKQVESNHTERIFEGGIEINGVIGIVEAPHNSYLAVITKASYVGTIIKSQIFKVDEIKFYPFSHEIVVSSSDERYIKMYQDYLKRNNLYFSERYDLTNSLRRYFNNLQSNSINKRNSSSIFENLNANYCWNYHLLKPFFISQCEGVFVPLINGYIGIRTVDSIIKEYTYIVISRKDHRRPGVRYLTRGADVHGNVANLGETEQILTYNDDDNIHIISYYQLRGSIPFIWSQEPDLSYTPKIKIKENLDSNIGVFRKHLSEISDEYTKIGIINLIDKKGDQKMLGELFQNMSKQTQSEHNTDFTWFDFHKECKNIQSLSKLLKLQNVKENLENFEYSHIVVPNSFSFNNYRIDQVNNVNFLSCQTGVFRVNCVDCLDRTNVVQTFFAKEVMRTVLKKVAFGLEEEFESYFYSVLNNMWADNGDQLALSYAGTKAMKSYYLRKGAYSLRGGLKDGYYSLKRYYVNNFYDGYNQDCIEYALGKIPLRNMNFKEHSSTFAKSIVLFNIIFTVILFYFLVFIFGKNEDFGQEIENERFFNKFVKIILFFAIFLATSKIIFKNLKEKIIDKPSNKDNVNNY